MNKNEHLQWCKTRALEYANAGELRNAVASMLSDLGKHAETAETINSPFGGILAMAGMMEAKNNNKKGVIDWINGFN